MAADILELSLVFHDYINQLYYSSTGSELSGNSYDKLATRMALFGQLGEFVEGQEEWQQHPERIMGHFLAVNGVTTEVRQLSIFLSVIGPKTYKLLCNLVSPDKPGNKSFAELVQALKSHYNPEPSEIVERYKFHTRFRKPGESVATFVSELRTLAQTCNFRDSLGDMLRDRLVCGINDALQKQVSCFNH